MVSMSGLYVVLFVLGKLSGAILVSWWWVCLPLVAVAACFVTAALFSIVALPYGSIGRR